MKPMSLVPDVIYIDNPASEASIKMAYQNKRKNYGITKEQFLALAEQQGNCCGACGDDASESIHTLHVDHDHYTNEIRGLICAGCNTALGWIEDSAERAEKLALYLRSCGTGVYVPYTRGG